MLKCQDLNLIRGMATVGEESPTHLYRETEYFSGYLQVFNLVNKCKLDEPQPLGVLGFGLLVYASFALWYSSISAMISSPDVFARIRAMTLVMFRVSSSPSLLAAGLSGLMRHAITPRGELFHR